MEHEILNIGLWNALRVPLVAILLPVALDNDYVTKSNQCEITDYICSQSRPATRKYLEVLETAVSKRPGSSAIICRLIGAEWAEGLEKIV